MIGEDGVIFKSPRISRDHIVACEQGLLDIIDISQEEPVQMLPDESWIGLDDIDF